MSIISFANTKGGAGRTTVALILATELAQRGHRVTVFDADPLQWASRWHRLTGPVANLHFVSNINENTIEEQVKSIRKAAGYVIIDLPGGLTSLLAKAIGLSDYVIIPAQGCAMDALGGAQVIELLQSLAADCNIKIPYAVALTRVNSIITTRALLAVKAMLAERQVTMLDTPLVERAAYRDMFNSGGTPAGLDPRRVSNLDKALDNARQFADAVLEQIPARIREKKAKRKTAPRATRAAA